VSLGVQCRFSLTWISCSNTWSTPEQESKYSAALQLILYLSDVDWHLLEAEFENVAVSFWTFGGVVLRIYYDTHGNSRQLTAQLDRCLKW
jgi:hypothetical protein